jgi:5S rRNA maturation endonuclease (ribonuclease M5)/archaellum biogenesis ATPase FlaH
MNGCDNLNVRQNQNSVYPTFSREEILESHNLLTECERRGMTFHKQGAELYAACPFHQDGKRPNFRVNADKGTWFCDVCGEGGGVVEFVAKTQAKSPKEVFTEWAKEMGGDQPNLKQGDNGQSIVATYDYTDESGNLVFQVCRYHPKTFKQRRPDPDNPGQWLWNMQGVTRVLYNLPAVSLSESVVIVEGEKDANTLAGLGIVSTCNAGGAGKWLDGYTESIAGKDVVLCGDNDEPGREHVAKILNSIKDAVRSVRQISVPKQFKDITDWVEHDSAAPQAIRDGIVSAPVVGGWHLLPVKSIVELEAEYRDFAQHVGDKGLDLGRWLPSLRCCVRALVPGELAMIVADTGTGKTAILQNIAYKSGLTTLLFEMELPGTLTFERFVALASDKSCHDIEECYQRGNTAGFDLRKLGHVWTCCQSGLTIKRMRQILDGASLKIGAKPDLVMVDYIQLTQGEGRSRYERTSTIAEQLKVMAKDTNTIIVSASQVGRKEDSEIGLHDAKGAGEIENSAGLVIGAWRNSEDKQKLTLRILKNTKGTAGHTFECVFKGDTMVISEPKTEMEDYPDRWIKRSQTKQLL